MTAKTETVEPTSSGRDQLYQAQEKIYPQSVSGLFRKIKWALLIVCLGIYYLLPFARWDRGAGLPNQAVLIDFPGRRFYFFSIEIWPQEVYYITGLLILSAILLFLMNAVAGRVWCGYLCPQTVWTDLFLLVERKIEGDRRERMILDRQPWTANKILRRVAKHVAWLVIAWWTGGAWVLYFADAPSLVKDLFFLQAPVVAYLWIGILTFTTYSLAGFMREQVCIYMCPWPRIQAALTDEWALNVSYRVDRGEPRGSLKSNDKLRAEGKHAGDCVDCKQCVVVCPTGTDIRLGMQLSCIQCGLCIDACDTVMDKINRPRGLIAYDTDINIARREQGLEPIWKLIRPRSVLYVAIIAVISGLMIYSLSTRSTLGVNVLHDRNPIYVVNSNGSIRNGFTIRLINKASTTRDFDISVEGLPEGAKLEIDGSSKDGPVKVGLDVEGDQTREVRALVFAPANATRSASTDIAFRIREKASGETATHRDFFKAPQPSSAK
ncbi:MAG: cytochrome c oxidase accessory protein CcoG [Ancalomicrobiaceae bacterium]|nr:cytochrome c oxidase accessory protein CcoG [Ancalomicrobiaceae bacterium]